MTLSNRASPTLRSPYIALHPSLGPRLEIDLSKYAGIVGRKTFPNIALPY
jgi:hypothetical protein